MKEQELSKTQLAKRMKTSRSALERLLDPDTLSRETVSQTGGAVPPKTSPAGKQLDLSVTNELQLRQIYGKHI